jgi:hypothetical protein
MFVSVVPWQNRNYANRIHVGTDVSVLLVLGRVAKFRHLKGNVPPRAQQYENLRDLNPSLPTECDAIKGTVPESDLTVVIRILIQF